MINFTEITEAVKTVLDNYNTDNKPYHITRNQKQNTDVNIASKGWIGIYRNRVNYEPYATGPRYQTEVEIRIEIQVADIHTAENCEAKLEEIVEFVMNALTVNLKRPLEGTVQLLTGFDIDYDDNFAEKTSIFHQTATLILSCEVMS